MSRRRATPSRGKLLVADDDPANRLAVAEMLRRAGFSVTEAGDGSEAAQTIERGKFDLVLLDIWMPGLNGLEVLARTRSVHPHPKVVIMTSDGTPDTLLNAIREQALEYINKPLPPKEVVAIVERVLRTDARPIEVISARPHWIELLIPCTREAAERIHGFLQRLEMDLPEEVRDQIGQAFRELVLNAVEWGGRFDPERTVRIATLRTSRMIMYRISDPGSGFDPANLPHAAVGQPVEDPTAHIAVRERLGIRDGGFGIMMTRALADELVYNESRNEVMFVKYL